MPALDPARQELLDLIRAKAEHPHPLAVLRRRVAEVGEDELPGLLAEWRGRPGRTAPAPALGGSADADGASDDEDRVANDLVDQDPDAAGLDVDDKEPWADHIVLYEGTAFYHGTSRDFDGPDVRGPAWFSMHRAVAEHFAEAYAEDGEVAPRVHVYRLIRNIRLPLIETERDFHAFLETFGIEYHGREDLCDGILACGQPGWHIPDNYQPGDDTFLADPSCLAYEMTYDPALGPERGRHPATADADAADRPFAPAR